MIDKSLGGAFWTAAAADCGDALLISNEMAKAFVRTTPFYVSRPPDADTVMHLDQSLQRGSSLVQITQRAG